MYVFRQYPVPPGLRFEVTMPIAADVTTVSNHGGTIQMWALVETEDTDLVSRCFGCIPTGFVFKPKKGELVEFIATFYPDDNLVFHLVEFVKDDYEDEHEDSDEED